MDEKDYKEYLALAKQYQKQMQKPYHKQLRVQRHEQTLGNDYSKKVKELPLIAEEIDALFWGKLVQLGWRIDNTPLLDGADSKARVTRLVFVCLECDLPLHAQNSMSITPSTAKKMCDVSLLKEKLVYHKTITKECRPVQESKAIPEAIPVFEKPAKGKRSEERL